MTEPIAEPTELTHKEKLEIRNKEICKEYMNWYDQDMYKTEFVKDLLERLTQKHGLVQGYIYQILKANQPLIEFHKGWEKHKRITELKRLRAEKTKSNKDVVDILDQERKEIEGDRPLIDQSVHNHKTFVYLDQKALEESKTGSNRIKTELPTE